MRVGSGLAFMLMLVPGWMWAQTAPHPYHQDCTSCHLAHQLQAQTPTGVAPAAPAKGGLAALFRKANRPVAARVLRDGLCLGCHQGAADVTRDQGAAKLPQWSGRGSSHIDGPFQERTLAFRKAVPGVRGRVRELKAECNGCHDVHVRTKGNSLPRGGFDAQGQAIKGARTTVAQICFGCHAGPESARLTRGHQDLGALFSEAAVSAHRPGAMPLRRQELPSLRAGLFNGPLDCTSCHTNPDGTGARGPHASPFPSLLKAEFARESDLGRFPGRDRVNELCFKCHDRYSILGNQSFALHAQHVTGFTPGSRAVPEGRKRAGVAAMPGAAWMAKFQGLGGLPQAAGLNAGLGQVTPCATCHDPHGSRELPALIRFDPQVVGRSSLGGPSFLRQGLGHGTCTLTCHGYDHVQSRY